MKTAIDEVIKNLKECRKMYPEDAFADDIEVAITTMQKYQKIEEIIDNWTKPEQIEWEIRKVIEDGNVNL